MPCCWSRAFPPQEGPLYVPYKEQRASGGMSIEASSAGKKINFSGPSGLVQTGLRLAESFLAGYKHVKDKRNPGLPEDDRSAADRAIGVFPRTCSFSFFSVEVAPIITIHKLTFLIWNKPKVI
jgi:hypothetical protein